MHTLLVWTLDTRRYALPLHCVERVLLAVALTPLPDAPAGVLGLINVRGRPVPVFDMRGRFQLPARAPGLSDLMVLARANQRPVAFIADSVAGAIAHSGEIMPVAEHLMPGRGFISGVAQLPDGMIVIHDLDAFLSLEQDECLRLALAPAA